MRRQKIANHLTFVRRQIVQNGGPPAPEDRVRIFFKALTRKGAFAVASVSTAGVRAWTINRCWASSAFEPSAHKRSAAVPACSCRSSRILRASSGNSRSGVLREFRRCLRKRPPRNPDSCRVLEAELPAARSGHQGIELTGEVCHPLLHLRAEIAGATQIVHTDALQ